MEIISILNKILYYHVLPVSYKNIQYGEIHNKVNKYVYLSFFKLIIITFEEQQKRLKTVYILALLT